MAGQIGAWGEAGAGEGRGGQERAGESRREQGRAGKGREGQGRAGKGREGQGRANRSPSSRKQWIPSSGRGVGGCGERRGGETRSAE